MRFPLTVPLAGGATDRAAELRPNPAAVAALWEEVGATVLPLWRGKAPIDLSGPPKISWIPTSTAVREAAREAPVLLGRGPASDGLAAARFAIDISHVDDPMTLGVFSPDVKFIDLRSIAAELPADDPPLWAEAKSLLDWHETHPMCSRCGAPTVISQAGWRRDCPACGAKHFPRTDPVVIMLIIHRSATHGDRVLVGRQPNWPPGMHSLLAGYIEPGETVEDAVRRETLEEAAIEVGVVGYLASQPWPFPSTLMIGCWGEALTDAITVDEEELEAARWMTKDEVRQALVGEHPEVNAPRRDAIARVLVEAWATDQLSLDFDAPGP